MAKLTKRMAELTELVKDRLVPTSPPWCGPPPAAYLMPTMSQTTPAAESANHENKPSTSFGFRHSKGRRGGGRQHSAAASEACFTCGQSGHWRRECPNLHNQHATDPHTEETARVGSVTVQPRPAEIYVKAYIGGKPIVCILDTGCERSLIGRKLIPNHTLSSTDVSLFAANGTSIPLLGAVKLSFNIEDIPITAEVAVTDALEVLILGIDWLSYNRCKWDFATATLLLNNREVLLHKRSNRSMYVCIIF